MYTNFLYDFFLEITLERQNFHFLTFIFQSFNFPQNYNLLKSKRNLVQFQNLFALKIYQFYFITCIPTDFEHYGRYGLHQNTKTFHFALLRQLIFKNGLFGGNREMGNFLSKFFHNHCVSDHLN